MSTTSINGKLLGVKLNGNLIAGAKDCKLTYTQAVRESTTKDNNGVTDKLEGLTEWKVDCDGLVLNPNFSSLFRLVTDRVLLTLTFTQTSPGDYQWIGDAYISSLDQDGPDQQSITFSASFQGTGVLNGAGIGA